MTKQYETSLKQTLNLITTNNELRKQNKNTEEAINVAKIEFSKLTNVLSGSQTRGQLGELMAEDIFRSAGFIKGVQYETQQVLENGTRPDFTINLPENKVIHMDSKFIWEHFQPLIEENLEQIDLEKREKKFFDTLKKNIIDEVGFKYINTQQNTLDNVIVFVPSDHILSYIYEKRMDLIQKAQSKKVTITSPGNLLLVVGVIKEFMKVVTIGENQSQIIHRWLVAFVGGTLLIACWYVRNEQIQHQHGIILRNWIWAATALYCLNIAIGALYILSWSPDNETFREILSLIHLLVGSTSFLTLATSWLAISAFALHEPEPEAL